MNWNESLVNKILLVEDDPVHARIMRRAFEEGHHHDQIVHLSDGESVLKALFQDEQDMPPDSQQPWNAPGNASTFSQAQTDAHGSVPDSELPTLILLDLRLPTVDGFEVLQAIRSHERTRSIPVIVISTSERQGDIRHCYNLGANAYITKPVDYNTFLEKLRSLRAFWLESAELPVDND
jgi:CheY-like chemotaxis protein